MREREKGIEGSKLMISPDPEPQNTVSLTSKGEPLHLQRVMAAPRIKSENDTKEDFCVILWK